MEELKKVLDCCFSLILIGMVGCGLMMVKRSQLYQLKKVEIVHLPKTDRPLYPMISERELLRLMGGPFAQNRPKEEISLAQLEIESFRSVLLNQSWVQEVWLQKQFPNTLIITVMHRLPRVILQSFEDGSLTYADAQGKSFGHLDLATATDLPLISGRLNAVNIKIAIALIQHWEHSQLNDTAAISSVMFEEATGFRFLVTYPLIATRERARAMIHLGQELDDPILTAKFFRLAQVVKYLSDRNIAAHQIWVDEGKKVVVKITKGS